MRALNLVLPRPSSRRIVGIALAAALAVGCGGDDDGSGSPDAAPASDAAESADAAPGGPDASSELFVLSSSSFDEGAEIPLRHTCMPDGEDLSPPLAWTGGPPAAGYALVLTDRSNDLIHSVLWDIPGSATSLPEGIEKVAEPAVPAGAKQALSFDGNTRGYRGPCPPNEHTYEFALYALPNNPLPGVTLDTERGDLVEILIAQALLATQLTGRFAPLD